MHANFVAKLLTATVFFVLSSVLVIEYRLVDRVAKRELVFGDEPQRVATSRSAHAPHTAATATTRAPPAAAATAATAAAASRSTSRRKSVDSTQIPSSTSSSSSSSKATRTSSSSKTTRTSSPSSSPSSTTTTTTSPAATSPPTTLRDAARNMQASLALSPAIGAGSEPNAMPADGWPTLPGAPAAYTIQLDARGQVGDAKGGEGFHKFTNEQMEARMAAAEASGHVRYAYPRPATPRAAGGVKIFGLVAVRNVADNIALFLELLANVTDAIAVLDDASTDDTVAAVLAAAARGINVELLVTKREWLRNEAQDKNLLLRATRRLGATAFIVPDYDETFSAACLEGDYLRTEIAALAPGMRLGLHWKEYWGGLEVHRIDPLQPNQNFLNRLIPIIFVDREDVTLYVPEKDRALKIHYPRIPMTGGGAVFADNRACVILEFRFVSLVNVYLKRIWYACLGALHGETRQALGRMNALLDAEPLVAAADPHWLTEPARRFGETFAGVEQIARWVAAYGRRPFAHIDMWQVDWLAVAERAAAPNAPPLTAEYFRNVNFTQSRFMENLQENLAPRDGKHHVDFDDVERAFGARVE